MVGEHTVLFLGAGEQLELCARATDRAIFARGALRAARWLAGQAAGPLRDADVLGLEHVTCTIFASASLRRQCEATLCGRISHGHGRLEAVEFPP